MPTKYTLPAACFVQVDVRDTQLRQVGPAASSCRPEQLPGLRCILRVVDYARMCSCSSACSHAETAEHSSPILMQLEDELAAALREADRHAAELGRLQLKV